MSRNSVWKGVFLIHLNRLKAFLVAWVFGAVLTGGVFAAEPFTAQLQDQIYVKNADGNPIFRLDVFEGGNYWYSDYYNTLVTATRPLTEAEKDASVRGLEYWTAVLKPFGTTVTPIVVRIGVNSETTMNAFAIPIQNEDDIERPLAVLLYGETEPGDSGLTGDPYGGAHAPISYNNYSVGWDTQPDSNLIETPNSLEPIMIHELGHTLGIGGIKSNDLLSGDKNEMVFNGLNAVEVFGGPVPMAHDWALWHPDSQEYAHFGIRNGLMTHLQLDNYPMFMEVELAALQDLGYTVDRRNFFGKSLYATDGESRIINNDTGFYNSRGLDANGNWLGYEVGAANTSPFGVGLHIYGDNYTVNQLADIYANGGGGAGVRVDGFNNTVNIPTGVTVAADGERGTGLLVAFGTGHTINSRGTISATGALGIGARFDFGAPNFGVPMASYGTYRDNKVNGVEQEERPDYVYVDLPIDGPLVNAFNLSGALLGGASQTGERYYSGELRDLGGRPIALMIGANAHVKEINVLNGASIYGDMISYWNPAAVTWNDNVKNNFTSYMTDLTFGRQMDANGAAIANSSDANFRLAYNGNILGADSFKVAVVGGRLNYSGAEIAAKSFDVTNAIFGVDGTAKIVADTIKFGDKSSLILGENSAAALTLSGATTLTNAAVTFNLAYQSLSAGEMLTTNTVLDLGNANAPKATLSVNGGANDGKYRLISINQIASASQDYATAQLFREDDLSSYEGIVANGDLFVQVKTNADGMSSVAGNDNGDFAGDLAAMRADGKMPGAVWAGVDAAYRNGNGGAAFSQLNPAQIGKAVVAMSLNAAQQANNALMIQFSDAVSQSIALNTLGGEIESATITAAAGGKPSATGATGAGYNNAPHFTGFAKAYGGFGSQTTTSSGKGYDFQGVGMLTGAGYRFAQELEVGAIFGYGYNRSEAYQGIGKATDHLLRLGFYGNFNYDNFYFVSTPTVGFHLLRNERNNDALLGATAISDRSAFDVSWANRAGYTFNLPGDIFITPSYGLALSYFNDPAHTESGAGEFNYHFNDYDSWSLLQGLELRLGKLVRVNERLALLPEIWGGWEHEYLTTNNLSGNFAATGGQFNVKVATIPADRALFGVGLKTVIGKKWEVYGRYDERLWDGGHLSQFNVGASVKF